MWSILIRSDSCKCVELSACLGLDHEGMVTWNDTASFPGTVCLEVYQGVLINGLCCHTSRHPKNYLTGKTIISREQNINTQPDKNSERSGVAIAAQAIGVPTTLL